MAKTYNFIEYPDGNPIIPVTKTEGEFRDNRNGIVCVNPTCDVDCYVNYIRYLNLHRDDWRSYGYLDLGMIPLVMGPSFLHEALYKYVVQKVAHTEIQMYNMPPVSFLYEVCKMPVQDVWVFKDEAASVVGVTSEQLNTELLIRWCFQL